MTQTERPTLSVAETASLFGISGWLVQQAVHDGSLPSVRVGRRILIPRSRLLAWIDGIDGPEADVSAAAANTAGLSQSGAGHPQSGQRGSGNPRLT